MLNGQKIIVVMPAYHAGLTLEQTYRELPHDIIDEVILVDDNSHDNTVTVAESLGITVIKHNENRGYGGNQKTCYQTALAHGADIVVMVHPDYQYDPKLAGAMISMIASGIYDAALGSRILGGGALKGGMPYWKYIANRFLTAFENLLLGAKLSEYHTGYRAFSRELLENIPFDDNSEDFVFDNQMLAQVILADYALGEISVPTKYFEAASSINFKRSVQYGIGVVGVSIVGLLARCKLWYHPIFSFLKK
ncbi:glycosyltransferase family 2 protein [Ostreibacterium oceani]|uniref:Glycosyltransferase n=1 Tax=Ostreibacterium oceani TaxID=2654998 RepID=A0A6N7EZJ0_9GAMM|nr:glycosyltransferase family 2 protein [Ostreibacterium oceani]MPV86779.1 glycosyltransferase [Ostreibacterium oceani]